MSNIENILKAIQTFKKEVGVEPHVIRLTQSQYDALKKDCVKNCYFVKGSSTQQGDSFSGVRIEIDNRLEGESHRVKH